VAVAETLEWYLRRLAVMSPAEVVHRAREQVRRGASKRQHHGWQQFDVGDGALMTLPPLRRLSDAWPDDVTRMATEAVNTPSLVFLGQTWPPAARLGGTPDLWTTDPVSGQQWPGPETFCFDVEWRREVEKGDVKFVLELNRLQFLHALCALAIRDGDKSAAQRAAELVLEWMEANPPYRGVNWLSMIELSLRLVSVAFVVAALQATTLDRPYRKPLRQFVAAHAHWLHRFPSLHSSANNHRVAEGLGLLVAAELMPDLPDASQYRREGRCILIDAAVTQFHADGAGVEQSPTYAAFTLEMILLGMELGRASGEPFPAETEARVARAANFLKTLLDAAGQAPRIGDDDEGRVFACPPLHEDRYVASVVAAAAGVLQRPDLAPPARSAHLRDVLFRAPQRAAPNANGIACFKAGGYTVVHEEVAGRKLLAVVDHGPLGLPPLAAHGHADALSLWLHLDDQPVLVDPGTLRYHSMQGWRDWLRSTTAHNTLDIAGESQSISAGPFNWRHKAECRLVSLRQGEEWELTAEHDGYNSRFGCNHRRSVGRVGRVLTVMDTLDGAPDDIPVRISFLIHPALTLEPADGALVVKHGSEALVRISASSDAEVVLGERLDERNAYSGRYNHIEPATRVSFRPRSMHSPHVVRFELL
jgi:uncharacterized heparinase superfamily protein